jgi:hypothetical protein
MHEDFRGFPINPDPNGSLWLSALIVFGGMGLLALIVGIAKATINSLLEKHATIWPFLIVAIATMVSTVWIYNQNYQTQGPGAVSLFFSFFFAFEGVGLIYLAIMWLVKTIKGKRRDEN